MNALRVYHVMTDSAALYGVAATGIREALTFVRERCEEEGTRPISVSPIALAGPTWSLGTVLRYT